MFEDNTVRNNKFHRPIIDQIGLVHVQLPLSVQSSYHYKNILQIGGVVWHCIDAKISPKAASEKAQITVSENRYTSLKIDVFQMAILTLLAPQETMRGRHFWYTRYCLPTLQFGGITECLRSFPPRLSIRVYLSSDNLVTYSTPLAGVTCVYT